MVRKILLAGFGSLFMLSIGVVAYGDARHPQSGGESLLQGNMRQDNSSTERVKGISLPVDSGRAPLMAAASKALSFSSRSHNFVIGGTSDIVTNHGGSSSGSSNGTGSTNGSSNGSSNGHNTPGQVPEPFSMILLGTGLVGLAAIVRKRRIS